MKLQLSLSQMYKALEKLKLPNGTVIRVPFSLYEQLRDREDPKSVLADNSIFVAYGLRRGVYVVPDQPIRPPRIDPPIELAEDQLVEWCYSEKQQRPRRHWWQWW